VVIDLTRRALGSLGGLGATQGLGRRAEDRWQTADQRDGRSSVWQQRTARACDCDGEGARLSRDDGEGGMGWMAWRRGEKRRAGRQAGKMGEQTGNSRIRRRLGADFDLIAGQRGLVRARARRGPRTAGDARGCGGWAERAFGQRRSPARWETVAIWRASAAVVAVGPLG
jgi:hypothetical protein